MPILDQDKKRKYAREWRQKRRDAWIKQNGPCKCGSEVDLDATWTGVGERVARLVWSCRKERQLEVLKNYVVMCRRCRLAVMALDPVIQGAILQLTMAGYGTRSVAQILGIDRSSVEKYRAVMPREIPDCPCGKAGLHHGRCWWRVDIKCLVKDEQYLAELRQIRKGGWMLNKVLAKIKETNGRR